MKPAKMLTSPIKASIMLFLTFGSAFAATEYKWIGGASGDWSNPENWDQNAVPDGDGHYVVFESTGDVEVNFNSDKSPHIGRLTCSSGHVKILSKGSTRTLYLGSSSYRINISDAASCMLSNVSFYCYYGNTTVTKVGAGTFTSYGSHFDNGGSSDLKIDEGVFRKLGGGNFGVKSVVLAPGAEMVLGGAVNMSKSPAWTLESDSTVTILNGGQGSCGGLMGAGDIVVGEGDGTTVLYLSTAKATAPFTGTITGGNLTVDLAATCAVSEESKFLIDASDRYSTCRFRRPYGLAFAADVGTFYLGAVGAYYGADTSAVRLEDVDGNPITLYSGLTDASGVSFSGAGNFMIRNSATVNGSRYTATGYIGAAEGGTLKLDANFDLTKAGGIQMVLGEGGSVEFQGAGAVEVPIRGTFNNVQLSKSSKKIEDFGAKATQLQLYSTTHELAGGEAVFETIDHNAGIEKRNVVSGGRYHGPTVSFGYDDVTSLKVPGWITFPGSNGTTSFRIDGGEFWFGGGWGCKHLTLGGGRTHFNSNFTLSPNNVQPILTFDGGDVVIEARGQSFEFQAQSSAYHHYVGRGGLSVRVSRRASTKNTSVYFYNPISADPTLQPGETDGGVTLHDHLVYRFYQPMAINGPVSFLDGDVYVRPNQVADGAAAFGTGDFILRNVLIELGREYSGAGTLRLATGADSALVYCGGSTFSFRYDTDREFQHVTASNLRRGGRGAVLTLSERDGCQNKIGTEGGDSFTVAGMSATNYVPAVIIDDSTGNDPHFAKYTAENGFAMIPDSEYKSSLDGCTENDIVYGSLTVGADAHIGAAKIPSWGWLTVNSGKTLTIGNGADPAMIIFKAAGGVTGSGKIDFGTSEGVFYPSYAREQKSYAHEVKCVLDGQNGVSYVGADYNNVRRMAISSANVYEGPTMVQGCIVYPRNAKAFSEGDVTVGPGQYRGGRVEFDEDVVFANNFHVGGWGWERTGAFVFDSNSEISGNVEILDDTRVRVTDGHVAKLSGTVSGDKLVVWGNAAGTTGVLALTGSNVHTGGTEVVKAVLQVADSAALGAGEVLLDGGTLTVANTEACTISNAVKGLGTVALAGKGAVSFANLASEDGVGFTLDLTKRRQTIDTLAGFKEVTTSRTDKIVLSVLNDESFSGAVPANVELYFGGEAPKPGCMIILR